MRRHYRSMSLAMGALFLVSCAKSAVDQKAASASDNEGAASEIVLTGTRDARQEAKRSLPDAEEPIAVVESPVIPPMAPPSSGKRRAFKTMTATATMRTISPVPNMRAR